MISRKKKVAKRVIKRRNPSNLRLKLDDYIYSQKMIDDAFSKMILNEIELDLEKQNLSLNFESKIQIKLLANIFATKSYYYKQLQNIVSKYEG
jgi:hypothetical protein